MAGSIHKSQFATTVKFDIDQTSLAALKSALQDVSTAASKAKFQGELTQELNDAAKAAEHLSDILTQSWNTKLNQFDLTKLNNSIRESYGSVDKLKNQLDAGGAVGANAFNKIGQAVLSTNIQLKQSNAWLDKMAITMSNTIRFGISSSIMNSFTGSIQKAYNYVQKLDKSLNDIRIVSDASATDMERFAKYANSAAQSLGSSTLDYTQAALIYYQQGLVEDQVKERADITVKMAHVTESTAQEVSDQLTAIWNNFYDGSQSLEFYADVLARLGAETASSSEEISQGLEKFAAVSKTVGLSYEYAAAALTTVTDRTRQSADVVGTAFKTLFARIQDLELGKTLDDGTTLGKYSEALQAVGVNIKDDFGQLKDMDNILDEMGSKWKTLSDDQKVALAQNVAGVRQYTQLMALMENWDFFKKNVDSARNATGSLQKQQDIYLDSIAAHMEKLSAQAEKLYASLLDSKAIKTFTDVLTGALKTINTYMTGLGGGFSSFLTLGGNAAALFSKQIGGAFAKNSINKEISKQNAANVVAQQDWVGKTAGSDATSKATREGLELETQYYEKILGIRSQLNEQELAEANNNLRAIGELKERISFAENWKEIATEAAGKTVESEDDINNALKAQKERRAEINSDLQEATEIIQKYNEYAKEDQGGSHDSIERYEAEKQAMEQILAYRKEINEAKKNGNKIDKEQYALYEKETKQLEGILQKIKNREPLTPEEETLALKGINQDLADANDKIHALEGAQRGVKESTDGTVVALKAEQEQRENNINQLEHEKQLAQEYSDITKTISLLMSTFSALSGVAKTLKDKDLSSWEKFKSILAVVATQGLMIGKNWKSISGAFNTVGTKFLPKLATSLGMTTTAEIAATEGATAMWSAMLGPIALVLAGIAAVVAIIWVLVENGRKAQAQVDNLRKAAEALDEESQNLQQSLNDVLSAFDNYNKLVSTLESCTEGTKQWENALNDVNMAALDILNKYPELAKVEGLFYRNASGALMVDQDKLDDYINTYKQQIALVKSSSLTASLAADQGQIEIDKDKLSSKINTNLYYDTNLQRDGVPNNYQQNRKVVDTFMENIDDLSNLTKSEYLAKLESLGIEAEYAESLQKYQEEVDGIAEQSDNVKKQLKNTAQAIAAIIVGDGGDKTNTRTIVAGNELEDKITAKTKELADKYTGSGINKASGNDNEIYKEMLKDLQGVAGFENYKAAANGNGVRGTDNNRSFAFQVNGEEKVYSAEEIASIIATSQSKNEVENGDFEQKADAIVEKISKKTGEQNNTFADALVNAIVNKDYSALSEAQIQQLKEYNEKGLLKGLISKEDAETLGLESEQEFEKGIETAINNWDPEESAKKLKARLDNMYQSMGEAINEDPETIKIMVADMKKLHKYINATEEELAELAKITLVFNQNAKKLSETISKNEKLLKEWAKSTKKATEFGTDTSRAVGALKKSFDKLFNSDVSENFLKDNFKDIQKMLDGDTKALDRLEYKLAKQHVLDLKVNMSDFKAAENAFQKLNNTDLTIGAIFKDEQALNDIQNFFQKAKLSEADAQAVLNEFGWKGDLEAVPVPDKVETQTNPVTTVTWKKHTSPTATNTFYNPNNGKAIAQQSSSTIYTPEYQTSYVSTQVNVPQEPYYVLKSQKDKGKSTLVGSVKSLGTGAVRKNAIKGGTGGSSGGSGGGGGSTPQKADAFKPEKDIYHKVNTQISKIDSTLKKLQKDEERFLGGKLFKNYLEQWKKLNTQIGNYKEKLKIAQGEQDKLKKKLEKQGAVFGEDNTVTNYQAVLDKKEAQIKSKIDKYNKERKKKSDKTNKARLEEIETLKQEYEELVNDLNRADELASDFIPEIEENIRAALDNQIEINIKAFEIKIKYSADIKDLTTEVNDFIEKSINGLSEDNKYGNFKLNQKNMAASLTKDDNGNLVGHLADQTEQLIRMQAQYDQLRAQGASIFGDNDVEGWKKHKEQLEAFMEEYSGYIEAQKEQLSLIREQKEAIDDLMDTQLENYGKIGDQLEHNRKLMQLVYGESAASRIEKISKAQVDNAEAQLNYAHQLNEESTEYLRIQNLALKNAKDQVDELAAAGDTESSLYQQAYNAMLEAEQNRDEAAQKRIERAEAEQEALNNYVDTINNDLVNAIEIALETLNNGLTESGKGLDYAREQWDLIGKEADIYLDTINNLQGQKDLESKYLESIEKATNPNVQKKLKAAMDEELEALKKKGDLTKYDLDRANKKYEITLAQIALEEAQQNKNKMRLRRDSQGNYRYQYVADEENIRKAQEKLTSLYTDLYNFDKERFLEVNNTILGIEADTQDKIREIYADTTKSKEEKEQEAALVIQSYNDQIKKWQDERAEAEKNVNESAFDDLKRLYGEDSEEYARACEDKQKTMAELIPQFKSEGNAIAANTELVDKNKEAWLAAEKAANDAANTITNKIIALEGPLDQLEQGVNKNIDAINKIIEQGASKIAEYKTQLAEMNTTLADNQTLLKQLNEEKGVVDLVTKSWKDLTDVKKDAMDEVTKEENENGILTTNYNEENANQNTENSGGEPEPERASGNQGVPVTTPKITNKFGQPSTWTEVKNSKAKTKALQEFLMSIGIGLPKYGADGSYGNETLNAVGKFQREKLGMSSIDGKFGPDTWARARAAGYDTGGYTGSWNNNGKLAFLHQKELVLNAQDTENILNTVAIMRNLMAAMNQDILSRLAGASAGTITNLGSGNAGLEQNVHIDANFPNATNSSEIEEALRNLVNVASQRITK